MVHLSKSPSGKLFIAVIAINHIPISVSKPIESRKGAIKNVRSLMKVFNNSILMLQDNTGQVPVMLQVTQDSLLQLTNKPGRPFIATDIPVVTPTPATATQSPKPVQQVSRPVKQPVVTKQVEAPKKPVPVVKLVPKKPVVAKKPAPKAKLKK